MTDATIQPRNAATVSPEAMAWDRAGAVAKALLGSFALARRKWQQGEAND